MMFGDVSSARSIARPAVVRLADDLEVGLALEDVADPDPEEGVVVDDQDPRPLAVAPVDRGRRVGVPVRHSS